MTLSTTAIITSATIPPRSVGIEYVIQWLLLREVRTKDDKLKVTKAELQAWTDRLEKAANLMTELSRARDSVRTDTDAAKLDNDTLIAINSVIKDLGLEGYFTTTGYTGTPINGKYETDAEIQTRAAAYATKITGSSKQTESWIWHREAAAKQYKRDRGDPIPGGVSGTNTGRDFKTAVIRLQTELESISQQHSTSMGEANEDLQVLTAFTSALSSLLQKMAELVNRITA